MSTPKRPRVVVNCVADRYASKASGERIVEVAGGGVGFLLSLVPIEGGGLRVDLYRADPAGVTVHRRREPGAVSITVQGGAPTWRGSVRR